MSTVLVGATLPQFSGDRNALLDAAHAAEHEGLDSLWLFDHLWPLSGSKQRPIFESYTTLAWLAAKTERIHLGTLVTRSSLRNPALVAKMAATIATIAPGRITIAIGSGDEMSRAENEAFGIEYFAEDRRVAQLEAMATIVHSFLEDADVTFRSPFARAEGLVPSPRPTPRPRLWLGGRADTVLSLAGRVADGWNGWGGSAERFAADAQQALAYARERPLELSWGGIAVLADTDSDAADLLGDRPRGDRLVGGPATVAERLRGFVAAGARHVILTPSGLPAGPDYYARLAEVRRLLN